MPRRLVAPILAALALACSEDFLPESYLDGLRILAVAPDPPEVGPSEPVTVRPAVYAPVGDPVTSAWTFCPLSAGSQAAYACVVPQCETPLAPAADGSVTAVPSELVLACLALLGGSLPSDPGAEVPDRIETLFRLRATSPGGPPREAVARVPLWTRGPPADRNLAPVISGVEIGGVTIADGGTAAPLPAGGALDVTVRIDPASIQSYLDSSGRAVQESVVVSFYASAGRFDDDRGEAPVASSILRAEDLLPPPADAEAVVWVVARDLRGGQAVRGPFRVPIAR